MARPRCVGLIETCEESGSYDLPAYLDALAPRMGDVQLVVALDSGAGNYEQLWVTTSLRGLVNGTLEVKILEEGVHSGDAGGVVPSSFRIARQILDRIDDSRTGVVKPAGVQLRHSRRPPRAGEAGRGDPGRQRCGSAFPGPRAATTRARRSLFARAGDEGPGRARAQPHVARGARGDRRRRPAARSRSAGNVQRPYTTLKLSLRLPPLVDGADGRARAASRCSRPIRPTRARQLRIRLGRHRAGTRRPSRRGSSAALDAASQANFGKPAAYMGEGGTIPFMGMLGVKFPEAQMLVTGVLGPKSNAHGPNEFLHVPYAKKVTVATAMVIAAVR